VQYGTIFLSSVDANAGNYSKAEDLLLGCGRIIVLTATSVTIKYKDYHKGGDEMKRKYAD